MSCGHPVALTRNDAGELQGSYFPGVYPQLVETHGTIFHFVGTESHWDAHSCESEGWSSPRCQRWLSVPTRLRHFYILNLM